MAGVTVPIDGDISPILAQFAKLPGRTQEEMDAVGRVIDQEINRGKIAKGFADLPGVSQKAAKKAANMLAREIDKGAREAEKSLQAVDKGLKVLGTSALDDIMDLGEGLAALGPAGIAVGAALAGAAAAAGALVAGGALVTFLYNAAAATGELHDEQRALDAAMLDVQTRIGGKFVPLFEELTIVAIAGTLALADFVDKVWEYIDVAGQWYNSGSLLAKALDASSGGMLKAAGTMVRLQDATDEGVRSQGTYIDKARELVGVLGDTREGVPPKLTKTAAAVRGLTEATKEAVPHLDAMSVILRGEGEDDTSFLDAQIVETIDAMNPKIESLADVWRVATQAVKEYVTNLVQAGSEADLTTTHVVNAFGAIGDLIGGLAEEGSDAASAAVAIQKAAALISVTISTAQAVMQALATLGPIAGPVAAGAITVTGLAQAALIAAQPESFHTGGVKGWSPDETMARVRPGEGVLTGQGVQAMGGAQGVAAANRGEVGGREIRVVAQYQHRVFDAMIGDNIRMRSSPLHGALRAGKRAGIKRG